MARQAKVAWFELPADDMQRASAFYNTVFGWDTPDMGMGNGSVLAITAPSDEQRNPKETGAINGDISPRSSTFDRQHLVVHVEDLDASLQAAQDAGGTIIQPRQDVPEAGMVYATIEDTEGNRVGLLQNL